jgi:hypothetical protein
MAGMELFLAGVAALAVLSVVVKARAGVRRAQAAAEIARVGTSPVSLVGRVVVTAVVIAGTQELVTTYAHNPALVWVVLGVPALITAHALTKAMTVTEIRPSSRGRGRR